MTASPTGDSTLRRPAGMGPDNSPQPTPGPADASPVVSKSQRKRDAHALQELGVRLVALSPAQLARMELPDVLREAVVAIQGMHAHGARLRQMQYIGKLMRQLEPDTLRLLYETLDTHRGRRT